MVQRASSSFLPVRLRSSGALAATPSSFAIIAASHHDERTSATFRNFALALAVFVALPPLLLAAFVIAVDPYYVFGSPSLRGFNSVRPYYEPRVLTAKPYQVRRQRPSAVALGSSRVEVGIDPRHPGWTNTNVFNFALPSSNSYEVMLAFLHAQKVGAPLEQAVVGLDFFAYNINFPVASDLLEQRFAREVSDEFDAFLKDTHPIATTLATMQERASALQGHLGRWMNPSILPLTATWPRRLRGMSSVPPANTMNSQGGPKVVRAPRFRPIGTRLDICRSTRTSQLKLRAVLSSAATITISPPVAARAGSADFSRRTGMRRIISPPIRMHAHGSRSGFTDRAIFIISSPASVRDA